jgi:hypothetical protein
MEIFKEMNKWMNGALKTLANFAIVLAGIQLAPLILPASPNPFWAFVIPVVILILAFILLEISK